MVVVDAETLKLLVAQRELEIVSCREQLQQWRDRAMQAEGAKHALNELLKLAGDSPAVGCEQAGSAENP